jgi:phytoene dehydrogenase-like protein
VTVVEAAAAPGGALRPVPLVDGWPDLPLAHLSYNLDPRVLQGMNLQRHGLTWATEDLATTALAAHGDHLVLTGPAGRHLQGPAADTDRTSWQALHSQLSRFARVLAPLRDMAPPRLARDAGNPWGKLAMIALRARMMGADDVRELGRILLTNAHDLLDDALSDTALKGALAFDATLGAWAGPRSPGTVLPWLDRLTGGGLALPVGGMAALGRAMVNAATAAGVHIQCNARVARIDVANDRVTGVTLADGQTLTAPLVASTTSPKQTLTRLVAPSELDAGMTTRARHIKARGGAAKLHLALTAMPDFRGADRRHRLVIAPSSDHVERAFNPAKYGETPDSPVMEVILTPGDRPTLSAIVQFAPHTPPDPDAARAALVAAALRVLQDHAPGLEQLVAHAQMMLPSDIERIWGLQGGNWHAGELSVEQMLFLRPFPGVTQYRGPIAGLWLSGAGCHPGGGVSGSPGWNAAAAIEAAT